MSFYHLSILENRGGVARLVVDLVIGKLVHLSYPLHKTPPKPHLIAPTNYGR